MDRELQKKYALAFRGMHQGPDLLLLPNVWDVASARVIEEAGFPAVATTSAGIAFSLGYPDGQKISREEMLARVARIAKAVAVPVTADVEGGYGKRPEDAAATAQAVIEAGAVGVNLEDGTGDPSRPLIDLPLQLEKIQAMRQAALHAGVLLVVNARTDIYLDQVGPESARYDETIKRAIAFRDAGAECVFVPGLKDQEIIRRLVSDVKCPVNILVGPGSPTISQLKELGVARVSLGSGPMRATLGVLERIARELRTSGTYSGMEGAPSHRAINEMMEP